MFDFYRNKAKGQYRLILRQGAPFPPETKADLWQLMGSKASVSDEASNEIVAKGYYLYKIVVSFKETIAPN